jgi:hypothetical protein
LPVFSFGVSCFTFLFLRFKVGGWKNGCKEYILFLMWYFSCFDFCFYHFKIINVYLDLQNLWVLLLLKISIIMKRDERLENSCIIFKYIFWVSPSRRGTNLSYSLSFFCLYSQIVFIFPLKLLK